MVKMYKDVETQIRKILKVKAKRIFENVFEKLDCERSIGEFRGYVHALGDMEFLPKSVELKICALDPFFFRSWRVFYKSVRVLIDSGFDAIAKGKPDDFDEILLDVLGYEFPTKRRA